MLKQVTVVLVMIVSFLYCKPDLEFGPYDMRISSFSICSGPKQKNCTSLDANVTGDMSIYINFQVLKTCSPAKGKVVALSSSGKVLTRFQMSKPCEHPYLRPMFDHLFNATKRCQILKNDYSKTIDVGKIANNYFAGSFIYGNFSFRAHFYNDECNFACTVLTVSITPKQSK